MIKATLLWAVLYPAWGAGSAAAAWAVFDSPGAGPPAVLEALKTEAGSAAFDPGPAGAGPAARPLVVTISGLEMSEIGVGLELRHLLPIWERLFPGRKADAAALEAELERFRERARAELKGTLDPMKPENYLETDVRGYLERNRLDAEVVHLSWSRDPGDTGAAVRDFQARLSELAAREPDRPLVLVTHSWGTVLAHETLWRLADGGQAVAVERLVTMGSPLAPSGTIARLFKALMDSTWSLRGNADRPPGVRRWVNLWAENDPYAGPVPDADEDVQVDARVAPYLDRLDAALSSGADREAVRRDRAELTHGRRWHEAYRGRFRAELASLGEAVDWDIFQENFPRVLPEAGAGMELAAL